MITDENYCLHKHFHYKEKQVKNNGKEVPEDIHPDDFIICHGGSVEHCSRYVEGIIYYLRVSLGRIK